MAEEINISFCLTLTFKLTAHAKRAPREWPGAPTEDARGRPMSPADRLLFSHPSSILSFLPLQIINYLTAYVFVLGSYTH